MTSMVPLMNVSAIVEVLTSSERLIVPATENFVTEPDCNDLVPEAELVTTRAAWEAAGRMAERGCFGGALGQLVMVESAHPEIADRLALLRGEWLIAIGRARDACGAFRVAESGQHSTVRMYARIGEVRCLIHAGDAQAESAIDSLARRYPELPHITGLRLELADVREAAGATETAIRAYQRLDLMHPGSRDALTARERLAALSARGVAVAPLMPSQQIERAERLMRTGPISLTKQAVTELAAANLPLNRDLSSRLSMMQSRIARFEARFGDASRYLVEGSRGTASSEEDARELAEQRVELEDAARAAEQEQALERIQSFRRGRAIRALSNTQLIRVLSIASPAGLRELVDEVLGVMATKNLPPLVRFDAAMLAMGAGSDERMLQLLGAIIESHQLGAAARYHYARTLERLGRTEEAIGEFRRVMESDRSQTLYYRLWAEQRLAALAPTEGDAQTSPLVATADLPVAVIASVTEDDAEAEDFDEEIAGEHSPSLVSPSLDPITDIDAMIAALGPVAEAHRETYPWFRRAIALLRLGEIESASDELHEAYLGWRDSTGRPVRRADMEAVARGSERVPERADWRMRRDRREITEAERIIVARVAEGVGDIGIRLGFTRFQGVDDRPRAYESLVRRAAVRYGVDPNLVLAVMRVESIYQRRIISYAGAIGLMQIMPRTGRNIAAALGRDDFTIVDLLEAETNIEFAAWYLASLIDRFDGRVPLAIASYNGGPHNVRRWMTEHSGNVPLDAFLERIPFSQTHRYVRRVLSHYAIYRAQQGLDMVALHTSVPANLAIDRVAF